MDVWVIELGVGGSGSVRMCFFDVFLGSLKMKKKRV